MTSARWSRARPLTVHFTFQYSDTPDFPHGKRQRAREAALWAVDPPEYFTEGIFVALKGPTYTAAQQAEVYGRFPEWSPQRHMFMDAPQRQAVRDILGLAHLDAYIFVDGRAAPDDDRLEPALRFFVKVGELRFAASGGVVPADRVLTLVHPVDAVTQADAGADAGFFTAL